MNFFLIFNGEKYQIAINYLYNSLLFYTIEYAVYIILFLYIN